MTSEESATPAEIKPLDLDGRDIHLVHMALAADAVGVQNLYPLTLSVGGNVISGVVVSEKDWFELSAQHMLREFTTKDEAEQEALESFARGFADNGKHGRSKPEDPSTWPNFIHLKDAAYFTSGALIPAKKDLLWRGQINRVDGWTYGGIHAV